MANYVRSREKLKLPSSEACIRHPGAYGRQCRRSLIHAQHLVCMHVFEALDDAARPAYVNALHHSLAAQSEVHPLIIGGKITAGRGHGRELPALSGFDRDLGADAIPIALVTDKINMSQ